MFKLVETEKATFPVALICRLLGVSRSGYYSWRKASPSKRKEMNERLVAAIKVIHADHHERYGSPRIHRELNEQGHGVGKHRVARLMRENGIKAHTKRKFRHTTDSEHKHPVSPNLLQQRFSTTAPNQAWVGDITYVWTMEGWAYVAVLLDLYSRRVVGWTLRKSLHRELALAALEMAITRRQPKRGLIHHSDRGSQYASADYRKVLRRHGLRSSMSAVGACWDNAVAESFFATLKKELVHRCVFQTRSEAYDAISDYIENYYNARRRHSTNDYITPIAFELTDNPRLAA